MEFFKSPLNINYLGQRRKAMVISVVLIICSIAFLLTRGLNFGVDFTGGTVVELGYAGPADLNEIRSTLQGSEFQGAVVQYYGSSQDVLIRLAPREDLNSAEISNKILGLLENDGQQIEMRRVEFVGAQVGQELTESGGLAMLFALFGILVYVAFRFQTRFALSAIVALVHDIIITIGFFSFVQMDFDLSVLAAILAVIGYSLNDTIVVFDRVRENFRRMRNSTPDEVFNRTINQTMSRTIITGVTTLLVLLALFYLGGEIIHGFAAALIFGVLIGTYSSIYIASPAALMMGVSRSDLMPVGKEGAKLSDRT